MKNRGKLARVLTTATVASNEFLKIYVTPEELIKQWCLRGRLSNKNRAGDFLFRVKFITGAALEHLFRTTKTPRAYIFSEKGDCFIFYEKICWESLFSELYSAYLLIECNLGERGESWRGREDIFISGHQESKGVVGRARWLKKYSVERTSRLLGLTWGRAPGIGQRAPVAFMTPSPKGDEKFRDTFSLNYSLRIWDTWTFLKFYEIFYTFCSFACLLLFLANVIKVVLPIIADLDPRWERDPRRAVALVARRGSGNYCSRVGKGVSAKAAGVR